MWKSLKFSCQELLIMSLYYRQKFRNLGVPEIAVKGFDGIGIFHELKKYIK